MILGCDAAGLDEEGNEVIVHSVIGDRDWRGDETLDPKRTLLSELHPGTFAERVAVPRRNLVPKPPGLSFEEAACLPTAWLTAIALGRAAGFRVWATSRDERKRERALELGAAAAFEPGARLPERVDAVLETVGEATWGHSVRSLRAGGTIVIAGATRHQPARRAEPRLLPPAPDRRFDDGDPGRARAARALLRSAGVRPLVDRVLPLSDAREGFAAMLAGDVFGKIVFTV